MNYIEKLDLQTEEVGELGTLEKHTIINNKPFSVDEYVGHDGDFLAIDGDYNDGFNQLNKTNGIGINCIVSKEVKKIKNKIDYFINVKDFGAIGDGNSHKVIDFFKTIEDCQKVYPSCLSLDDEIDLLALEKGLTYARDKGTVLYINNLTLIINRSLYVRKNSNLQATMGSVIKGESENTALVHFDNTKNCKWENITIERIGQTYGRYCNAVEIRDKADNTLILENCIFKNNCTIVDSNVSGVSGIQIHFRCSPTLINCIGYGGGNESSRYCTGIRVGGIGNSSASPRLINCVGYGGKGYSPHGIEIDNTESGGYVVLDNCIGYGGQGEGGHGFSIDDVSDGILKNCIGQGGNLGGDGLIVWGSCNMTIENCKFSSIKGNGVTCVNGNVTLKNCSITMGYESDKCRGVSCGWFANTTLINCTITSPTKSFRHYHNNSNQIILSENSNQIIKHIGLQTLKSFSSDVKLKVGLSNGGSEIMPETILNYNSESWADIKINDNVVIPKNTPIYLTLNKTISDDSFVILFNFAVGDDLQKGIVISANNKVVIDGCKIDVDNFSNSVGIHNTTNCDLTIINSTINAKSGKAIVSDIDLSGVNVISNCVIKGTTTNVGQLDDIKNLRTKKITSFDGGGIDFYINDSCAMTISSVSNGLLPYKGNNALTLGNTNYFWKEGYFKDGILVKSPNGTIYRLKVNDSGQVVASN